MVDAGDTGNRGLLVTSYFGRSMLRCWAWVEGTHATLMAEMQYPQTPNLTEPVAPLLRRLEVKCAESRKR